MSAVPVDPALIAEQLGDAARFVGCVGIGVSLLTGKAVDGLTELLHYARAVRRCNARRRRAWIVAQREARR